MSCIYIGGHEKPLTYYKVLNVSFVTSLKAYSRAITNYKLSFLSMTVKPILNQMLNRLTCFTCFSYPLHSHPFPSYSHHWCSSVPRHFFVSNLQASCSRRCRIAVPRSSWLPRSLHTAWPPSFHRKSLVSRFVQPLLKKRKERRMNSKTDQVKGQW